MINSIRNNFESLKLQIKSNIDIFTIFETETGDTFSYSQFLIECFSAPYRLFCDSYGGEIVSCVSEDIPCNLLAIENKPIENFFVEINLCNDK